MYRPDACGPCAAPAVNPAAYTRPAAYPPGRRTLP